MKTQRLVQVWINLRVDGERAIELCTRAVYKKLPTDLDMPDGHSMYDEEEPIDVVLCPSEDESLEIQELADEEFGVSV